MQHLNKIEDDAGGIARKKNRATTTQRVGCRSTIPKNVSFFPMTIQESWGYEPVKLQSSVTIILGGKRGSDVRHVMIIVSQLLRKGRKYETREEKHERAKVSYLKSELSRGWGWRFDESEESARKAIWEHW